MSTASLSPKNIIPPELKIKSIREVIFLFFDDQMAYTKIINRITTHIQAMPPSILDHFTKTLGLQLAVADWDKHGNVCFAKDPGMRPEFRTTFKAVDLWDYYYALMHSFMFWESSYGREEELPYPGMDHFWKMARYGSDLRRAHALKMSFKNPGISIYGKNSQKVSPMSDRMMVNEEARAGRLYLNPKCYIEHIPLSDLEYEIGAIHPLKKWIEKHIHQKLSDAQIDRFIQIILAVGQTRLVQQDIDAFLSHTSSAVEWLNP